MCDRRDVVSYEGVGIVLERFRCFVENSLMESVVVVVVVVLLCNGLTLLPSVVKHSRVALKMGSVVVTPN